MNEGQCQSCFTENLKNLGVVRQITYAILSNTKIYLMLNEFLSVEISNKICPTSIGNHLEKILHYLKGWIKCSLSSLPMPRSCELLFHDYI